MLGVLERSRIPKAQLEYVASTLPVWTLSQPEITVRVAAADSGVIDQVGVQFRDVAGENMMRAWSTFRTRPDFAERIGAVVGAMGIESAERFEIRCYRSLQPRLEATFVPSTAKFQRPIRA